jgi:hypothetical protein
MTVMTKKGNIQFNIEPELWGGGLYRQPECEADHLPSSAKIKSGHNFVPHVPSWFDVNGVCNLTFTFRILVVMTIYKIFVLAGRNLSILALSTSPATVQIPY